MDPITTSLVCLTIAAVAVIVVVLHFGKPPAESELDRWRRLSPPNPIKLPPARVSGLESAQVARVIRLDRSDR